MLGETLGIDQIDCEIMDLVQKEPNLTHAQIAEHVNRSQPTIGMRIKKLENLGVLKYQAGVTIKNKDLCFARVDLLARNPHEIFKIIKKCPFLLNGFRISGSMNISILMVGLNQKDVERVINYHFRRNSDILKVHMDYITDAALDLIIPLNLYHEQDKECVICNDEHLDFE